MKKYYLEVIGGTNPNQLYVVNAASVTISVTNASYSNDIYEFWSEDGEPIAKYPINRTIIKSIEVTSK